MFTVKAVYVDAVARLKAELGAEEEQDRPAAGAGA